MHDLSRLATAAREGDRERLELFVRAIQGDVWRYCVHLVGRGEADDLAQEALLRVVAHLHRWERGPVKSWVFGVTRNVCLEHRRRRRRRRTTVAEDIGADLVAVDDVELVSTVELVRSLPADQREAVVLTQIIGLSYTDASAVVGCPVGTIRSRVARGRDALARNLRAARSADG